MGYYDYDCQIFESFNDLKEKYPKIAEKLMDDVGGGEWENDQLFYYPTIEDYAVYELTEGWYSSHDLSLDYNGAPNPLDYIDYDAFGNALINRWDESVCWTDETAVITTSYGW